MVLIKGSNKRRRENRNEIMEEEALKGLDNNKQIMKREWKVNNNKHHNICMCLAKMKEK